MAARSSVWGGVRYGGAAEEVVRDARREGGGAGGPGEEEENAWLAWAGYFSSGFLFSPVFFFLFLIRRRMGVVSRSGGDTLPFSEKTLVVEAKDGNEEEEEREKEDAEDTRGVALRCEEDNGGRRGEDFPDKGPSHTCKGVKEETKDALHLDGVSCLFCGCGGGDTVFFSFSLATPPPLRDVGGTLFASDGDTVENVSNPLEPVDKFGERRFLR